MTRWMLGFHVSVRFLRTDAFQSRSTVVEAVGALARFTQRGQRAYEQDKHAEVGTHGGDNGHQGCEVGVGQRQRADADMSSVL